LAVALFCVAACAALVTALILRRTEAATGAVTTEPAAPAGAPSARPAADDEPSFVGVLLPPQSVNVASKEEGKIVNIHVRVGDVVDEGEVLAELDDSVKKHELAIARATRGAAQAQSYGAGVDLASAREKKKRRAATVLVGGQDIALVSGEEAADARYEERSAVSRAASAGANVRVAAAHIAQLEAELEQLVLRAPFSGVIAARYADPGAFLHAGEPVARVLGSGGLRVRFAIAEEDAQQLKQGQAIWCKLEGGELKGKVEQVAPEVEPSSRTIFAEGSIDEEASACGGDCARLAGRTVRVVALPNAAPPKSSLEKTNGPGARAPL
jgi:RND family efflux transporter MFP subunit